jgi:predicted HNH restriction endonuclease
MVMKMSIKRYSELITLPTFEERYRYLRLQGKVGKETFGYDRYINQVLYQRDPRWRSVRDQVIVRDNGCDLGVEGYDIYGKIIVHHMNPITLEDIEKETDFLFNPEYLICVTHMTHNAIHYGDENLLPKAPVERTPFDTCPWKRV